MEQKLMSQVPAGSSFQYTPPHRSRPLKFLVLKQYVGFSWVKKAGERTGEKIKVQRTKVRYIGSYTETKDDNRFANGYDANYNERTFDSAGIYVMQIQN